MQRTKQRKPSKLKTEAPEKGGRRYEKGVFRTYDQTWQKLAGKSPILNAKSAARSMRNAGQMSHIGGCKGLLAQLEGSPDAEPGHQKYYREDNNFKKALIPVAEARLRQVFVKFKNWQKSQVAEGRALEPPTDWPKDLRKKRVAAEAELDLRRLEKHKVKERIHELKEAAGKLNKARPVLPDGPVGKFQGGVPGKGKIKSVDGQQISFSPEGRPYIDQEDSPYHLMAIADYRDMSKKWKRKNRIFDMDIPERRNEYREKMQEAGKADQLPASFTHRKFEKMIKGETKFKGQENWPDFTPWPENPSWPDDAKKITEIEEMGP